MFQTSGILERLESIKPVFIESKNRLEFAASLHQFRTEVDRPDSRGAVFFGVCRGKVR